MFRKHPETTFIAAHFGWYANDLATLDSLLTDLPNVMVEFGAVIAELGRQPRMALKFFTKHQDRILFGKDSWVPEEYTTSFRVLETDAEYSTYQQNYHDFWSMHCPGLPEDNLQKRTKQNALQIFPAMTDNLA